VNVLALLIPLQVAALWWIPVVILANAAFDPWPRLRGLRFGAILVALAAFAWRPHVSDAPVFADFHGLLTVLFESTVGRVSLILAVLWLIFQMLVSRDLVRMAGSAVVLLFGLLLSGSFYGRFSDPMHQLSPWVDVQEWAREHTEAKDRFLTPPQFGGFRVFSQRTTFVEWKDGTLQYFSPEFSRAWMKRIGLFQDDVGRWRPWDVDQLQRLARDKLVDYVVTTRGVELPFETAYENAAFRVYRVAVKR
jgi:hypothetical protein